MKKFFNILIILSFIFVVVYLWQQNLIIPELPFVEWIVPSMLLLFAGFYISTVSWKISLSRHGIQISKRDALISHGQSVFAKYIPGKIWVILGRAGYISTNRNALKNNSFVSFKEQLIYTWVGFVISAVPTVIFYKFQWLSVIMVLIIIGLTLFLFVKNFHRLGLRLIQWIIRRKIELPVLDFKSSLPIIAATGFIWICWTLAFYFFCRIFSMDITPIMAFAFPLSVSFGLIALFLPGGLGLREGIIIGYLTLAGMDTETATTISFLNRFAFIGGEVFIFLASLIARIIKGSDKKPTLHS